MSNQSHTKDHKLWVSQAASGNISAQYISVSALLKTKVAFSLSCSSISSLLIIKKKKLSKKKRDYKKVHVYWQGCSSANTQLLGELEEK